MFLIVYSNYSGTARTLPSESEAQSLAGSTAGLIRNEYRHSNKSYQPPTGDDDSLHLTNIREPVRSRPIRSQDHIQNAPIISLPYQVSEVMLTLKIGCILQLQ